VAVQKIRLIAITLAGLFLASACAAGQIAATANERATLDGVDRRVGDMALLGLSLAPPAKGPSYAPGSNIPINMVLVNSGRQTDKLVGITSTAATSWASYSPDAANLVLNARGARHSPGSTSVAIQPNSRVSSSPASNSQFILMHTTQRLWPGTIVHLVFRFQNAGTINVPVPIHLTEGGNGGLTVPPVQNSSEVGD
jgi:hypothetical protein